MESVKWGDEGNINISRQIDREIDNQWIETDGKPVKLIGKKARADCVTKGRRMRRQYLMKKMWNMLTVNFSLFKVCRHDSLDGSKFIFSSYP